MFKPLFCGCAVLVLCGCSPIHYVRYQPPDLKQDAAEIFVDSLTKSDYDPHTAIQSFDKDGCFTGSTYIDNSTRLYADKETFFQFWKKTVPNTTCTTYFSFMPEKNVKYKVTGKEVKVPTGRRALLISGWTPVMQILCDVSVVKVDENGSETRVQMRGYRLSEDRQCPRVLPTVTEKE